MDDPSGPKRLIPTGVTADRYLADLEILRWHLLDEMSFTAVSISGTAYSRDPYLELDAPSESTPTGYEPDNSWLRRFGRA